jgi:hypothetical protein
MTPICLPTRSMWNDDFINYKTTVSGYGRTEPVPIEGRDQSACRLQKVDMHVVGGEACQNVI